MLQQQNNTWKQKQSPFERNANKLLKLTIEFKVSYCITLNGQDIWEHMGSNLNKSQNQAISSKTAQVMELLLQKEERFENLLAPVHHLLLGPWCRGLFIADRSAHFCARTAITVSCVNAEFLCDNLLRWARGSGAGLDELNVIGWEHSKMAVWAVASPPSLVYHLNPGDDLVGIKWDLRVISWWEGAGSRKRQQVTCQTLTSLEFDVLNQQECTKFR